MCVLDTDLAVSVYFGLDHNMGFTTSLIQCLFITFCFINCSSAQKGKDCEQDKDCNLHQTCHYGYCRCDLGYVKNIHHCFKLRRYGQNCEFEEQCNDFRMACQTRPRETIKRCICGSFYEWSPEFDQCVPSSNFTEQVRNLQENTTWEDNIRLTGERVFSNIAAAGLFVVSVGLVCILSGIVYGCCCRKRRLDKKVMDDAEDMRVQEVADSGTGGTYVALPTDLTGQSSIMPIG